MYKTINTEINKIKVVLLALWDYQHNKEAKEIINQFRDEIDEINKGN